MATVNFSVPEEVKVAFNATFRKEKKSASIAALMREAVDRAQRKDRARQAATRILERRETAPIVSTAECREARCPASSSFERGDKQRKALEPWAFSWLAAKLVKCHLPFFVKEPFDSSSFHAKNYVCTSMSRIQMERPCSG